VTGDRGSQRVRQRAGKKVFGIGLSRTGTWSLTSALAALGFRALHFPVNLKQIDNHDALTDTPIAADFETLDLLYPGSKFIYTTRELDDWLESCRALWLRRQAVFDRSSLVSGFHRRLYGGTGFDPARFVAAYRRHDDRVRSYFRDRPEDLLVLDICSGDAAWEPLCSFLGVPVPDAPFPRAHTAARVDQILLRLLHLEKDVARVARITEVSEEYLEDLRRSEAFRSHDPQAPLEFDGRAEAVHLAKRIYGHYGRDVGIIADKLKIPKAALEAAISRMERRERAYREIARDRVP
jgi:hypothetical protein